jgi:hypothetical protein
MKKYLFVVLIIVICLSHSVFSDGMYLSSHDSHMTEPDQKAVISWNGEKETMILVSTVQSDKISNFAWVVPIQSSIKPEITEGDISIFTKIIRFFSNKKDKPSFGVEKLGIEVIETKEIDIYDISILKADNASLLIQWLNENGYMIPENIEPVLDYYVEKPDFYFVANKIDLTNKYDDAQNIINRYENKYAEGFSDALFGAIIYYDSDKFSKELSLKIIRNRPFEKYNGHYNYMYFTFMDEDEYKKLRELYYFEFGDLGKLSEYEIEDFILEPGTTDFYCLREAFNEDGYEKINMMGNNNEYSLGMCEEIETYFGSIDAFIEKYQSVDWNKLNSDYLEVKSKVTELLDGEYSKITEDELIQIKEYEETLQNLKIGMGTPLKFEFYPEKPYYPLEISSLSIGNTNIEIYVITKNPVFDLTGILNATKSYTFSNDFKEYLGDSIDIGNSRYITRLNYEGALSELSEDAIFEEEDMGFFDYYMTTFQEWFASWWIF